MRSNPWATISKWAGMSLLTVHLAATVIENTPDSFNQDLRKYTGGWPLPGWRFFAPNPGIQNVHLLVRTMEQECDATGPWRDVTPSVSHGIRQMIWNPQSRGPKALFDAMQQLSVLNGNYAQFDWITSTQAYELVESAARSAVTETQGQTTHYQFLMMNVFPSAEEGARMKPIMTSEWISMTFDEAERSTHGER